MNNYIHRVTNQSRNYVQLIVLHKSDRLSYDLVLGPDQSVDYASLYGAASAPVPVADSAADFADAHIWLRVGDRVSALYARGGKVRHAADGRFDERAPSLGGFAGPGPIALVVGPEGGVAGELVRFATGPQIAAVAWANSRYALYGTNQRDGTLVQKAYLTAHWAPWESLGKPAAGLAGPIAAASWADFRYSVYALGSDGLLYEKAWLTDRWEEWMQHASPDGVALRDFAAVKWETGRYGIYAVGNNGDLYQRWWGLNQWHPWENLGRPDPIGLAGAITAVSWSGYRYGVYALGTDGQVWQKWYGSGWSGWESVGRPDSPLRTLASTSWSDRQYAIAGVCQDGNLWCREYRHAWSPWKNLGKPEASPLAGPACAVSWRLGAYAYYAQGEDGLLYELYEGHWRALDAS